MINRQQLARQTVTAQAKNLRGQVAALVYCRSPIRHAQEWKARVTIDDPKTFTSTWMAMTGYRLQPHGRIMEYFCENNRNLADEDGKIGTKLPGR